MEKYINTELLVLVPVLYILGAGIKRSRLADRWIPVILGATAILLSALWVISTEDISGMQEWLTAIFTAVTQGILLAGTSVYVNQLYVQGKKKE